MRAVNLLPRDVAKTRSRKVNVPVLTGMVAGVLVVAVLAGGFVRESSKVAHKRTELEAARAELALVPAPVAQDSTSSTLVSEQSRRVSALQLALNGRVAWDRVLREISLVMPDDVWLSGLTLQVPSSSSTALPPTDGTTAAPTTSGTSTLPTDFTMNGKAFSHVGVARLLSRLALLPDLDDVTLGHSTRQTTPGKRGSVEFSVLANVRTPGGAS
jgi:Tfp pilus assembly protein PilN